METTPTSKPPSTPTIVVADRGWCWVGNVTQSSESVTITDASCIRYWGTKRGIGQLAIEGPQRETKLDPAGTVIVPMRAVIALLPCKTAW